MNGSPDTGGQPVALVIQRRIADDGFAAFARWNGEVGEVLKAWPGFLNQEVVPPQPPAHVDWVTIVRFASPAAARAWLQSDVRAKLIAEVQRFFVGSEDVHILPDTGVERDSAVSAVISFKVPDGLEDAFLKWQQRIQAAEAEFKGFLRHKIERPIPGLHDEWIVILSFDSDANLNAWLDSPLRQTLLKEGARFNAGMNVKRASYGFNFWFPAGKVQAPEQGAGLIWKSNLIVLLVLYPVVYLWGYFISAPLIDRNGVPVWLSLFVGNLVSTQLLGWWLVPAAFKALDWWITPKAALGRQIAGYALLAALYAASMGLCALLLAWHWGR
jgi:antibiotic biosynthesis monooxygenase (ABM) superfamily enzyme